jgi:hypothetical protein
VVPVEFVCTLEELDVVAITNTSNLISKIK